MHGRLLSIDIFFVAKLPSTVFTSTMLHFVTRDCHYCNCCCCSLWARFQNVIESTLVTYFWKSSAPQIKECYINLEMECRWTENMELFALQIQKATIEWADKETEHERERKREKNGLRLVNNEKNRRRLRPMLQLKIWTTECWYWHWTLCMSLYWQNTPLWWWDKQWLCLFFFLCWKSVVECKLMWMWMNFVYAKLRNFCAIDAH